MMKRVVIRLLLKFIQAHGLKELMLIKMNMKNYVTEQPFKKKLQLEDPMIKILMLLNTLLVILNHSLSNWLNFSVLNMKRNSMLLGWHSM